MPSPSVPGRRETISRRYAQPLHVKPHRIRPRRHVAHHDLALLVGRAVRHARPHDRVLPCGIDLWPCVEGAAPGPCAVRAGGVGEVVGSHPRHLRGIGLIFRDVDDKVRRELARHELEPKVLKHLAVVGRERGVEHDGVQLRARHAQAVARKGGVGHREQGVVAIDVHGHLARLVRDEGIVDVHLPAPWPTLTHDDGIDRGRRGQSSGKKKCCKKRSHG